MICSLFQQKKIPNILSKPPVVRYYLQSDRDIAKRSETKDMTQSLLIALESSNRGTQLWSQRPSSAGLPTISHITCFFVNTDAQGEGCFVNFITFSPNLRGTEVISVEHLDLPKYRFVTSFFIICSPLDYFLIYKTFAMQV